MAKTPILLSLRGVGVSSSEIGCGGSDCDLVKHNNNCYSAKLAAYCPITVS